MSSKQFLAWMLWCLAAYAQQATIPTNGSATFDLKPMRTGARTGKVLISQGQDGLVITGSIAGGAPQFATTAAEMGTRDHVEIWIAPPTAPTLPPVGWGNQFGMETEKTEKDCAELAHEPKEIRECQAWFRAQPAYRTRFRKLFLRQYQIAPNLSIESYAKAAYDEIVTKHNKMDVAPLKSLAPKGSVQFKAQQDAAGYTFEARIPWSAFPPMNSLQMDRVNVMVDVFSANPAGAATQPYSSTAAARKYGDVSTMNALTLAVPRIYQITHCQYPLKAHDIYYDEHPAWFFPSNTDLLNKVFILQNHAAGYQYAPGGLSPVVRMARFTEQTAAPGEYVCGPNLAVHRSGQTTVFDAILEGDSFEVKRNPDGSLLVKEGPLVSYSEFGSGTCGACPRIVADMHRITPAGKYELALEINETVDGLTLSDADIQVVPDWTRVTVFRETEPEGKSATWTAETYCSTGGAYQSCGLRKDVPAPKQRTLDLK